MGQMMRGMEGMMSGPVPRPLMSTLLDAERLGEAERVALGKAADQRVHRGLELLDRATRELATARRARDDAAISRAIKLLEEGAELWETGTAVQRALSSPPATARATGLRWFRSRMNLEMPDDVSAWPWGWSPVHLGIMAILAVTAGGGMVLYLYKIRRSLALLARLTRGPQP